MKNINKLLIYMMFLAMPMAVSAQIPPEDAWIKEFPQTNFEKSSISYDEIVTDGPRRDQIPPIHNPKYIDAKQDRELGPLEPVLSVAINGDARAYPLRILLWHEIVNDTIGGVPVLVSYCPLCNSGVVFDRRVGDKTLSFGNTGRIRHFDMVMYDQQTESWWQQFLGEAIVGDLTGQIMKLLPARLESLQRFQARFPDGKLLVPNDDRARPYGSTPYIGMDTSSPRVFKRYELPKGIDSMDRVVVIHDEAWPVSLVKERGSITVRDLTITWEPGQNSIHDERKIANGRDVGNIVVRQKTADGQEDFPYDVTFAFAFKAFRPDGKLHLQ